jgi:hypothetical protein
MSPSVMSSGPTILTCLLESLARGTHPCVHIHSKAIQWLDFSQIYNADIFGILGFRASRVRTSTHLELLVHRNSEITIYSST